MNRQDLSSEKGVTLVELLVTLAIIGLVGAMIIGILLGGIGSFKKVNSQVSLHDEANYVMTQFVNKIYVATKVERVYKIGSSIKTESDMEKESLMPPSCQSLIKVTNYEGEVTTVGFNNEKAYINDTEINPSGYKIDCTESKLTIDSPHNIVLINLVIKESGSSGKQVELNNNVSYVKVDEGAGDSNETE